MTAKKTDRNTKYKAPGDTSNFTIDWASFLKTDTIESSTWELTCDDDSDDYLEIVGDSKTDTTATIQLTKGVEGRWYCLMNTINTAAGSTYVQTLWVKVTDR